MCVCVVQEPHPLRLTLEEVDKRRAQLDSCALSVFEHLGELKSFFVEVSPLQSRLHHHLCCLKKLHWFFASAGHQ